MKLKKAEAEIIQLARVCRLSTADRRGVPHCVPVCPAFDGKKIYFGSEKRAKKVRNIIGNPAVAVVFDDYSEGWSWLRGLMVQGEARIIDRAAFRRIRRLLYEKYPQYRKEAPLGEKDSVIVEITPRRSFSWGL